MWALTAPKTREHFQVLSLVFGGGNDEDNEGRGKDGGSDV